MTVKELIERLQQLPEDAAVMMPCKEDGYNFVERLLHGEMVRTGYTTAWGIVGIGPYDTVAVVQASQHRAKVLGASFNAVWLE